MITIIYARGINTCSASGGLSVSKGSYQTEHSALSWYKTREAVRWHRVLERGRYGVHWVHKYGLF